MSLSIHRYIPNHIYSKSKDPEVPNPPQKKPQYFFQPRSTERAAGQNLEGLEPPLWRSLIITSE